MEEEEIPWRLCGGLLPRKLTLMRKKKKPVPLVVSRYFSCERRGRRKEDGKSIYHREETIASEAGKGNLPTVDLFLVQGYSKKLEIRISIPPPPASYYGKTFFPPIISLPRFSHANRVSLSSSSKRTICSLTERRRIAIDVVLAESIVELTVETRFKHYGNLKGERKSFFHSPRGMEERDRRLTVRKRSPYVLSFIDFVCERNVRAFHGSFVSSYIWLFPFPKRLRRRSESATRVAVETPY